MVIRLGRRRGPEWGAILLSLGAYRGFRRCLALTVVSVVALNAELVAQNDGDAAADVHLDDAVAGEPVGERRAEPIIVTATRLESDVFDVPYSVDSLDGRYLQHTRARTLPDALREVPGVLVQKTAHGQGSPFIRGFTGFRTLLLIDGIRLNNAVFRNGPNQYWNTVDPLTIDRLEVVKGPSSVLYGSDSIGGTVNVISRSRAPKAAGRGPAIGGFDSERRLYYRYASAENSHSVRGEIGAGLSERVVILGGISWKDFDDLSAGRHLGELPRTGYEELDGDFKTTVRLRENLDLILAYQRGEVFDVPRTHSTIFSKSYRGSTVGTDLQRELDNRRQLTYAQLHWEEPTDWLSSARFSLSYHLHEEDEVRVRSNGRRRKQGFEDSQYGVWFQLVSPSPVGELTYGVEYYHDEVDSFFREFNPDGSLRVQRDRGPIADNSSYDLVGVYLQDRIAVNDDLEITAGGRFTYARADVDEVDVDPASAPDLDSFDEDYASVVGSLRALYYVTDSWNLFGGVSQGFRAPNLADLTRFDASRSGEVETPAPDLDPERFVSLEIGTKVRLDDLRLEGTFAYHYTFIDGLIVRFPTGNVIDGEPEVTKDNVGDGFVHGVELGLSWNFYEGFTAFGQLTWLEGENDVLDDIGNEDREPLSRIQPATALLGMRWDSPERKYWVEATALVANNQDRLSPRDEGDTQRIPPGGTPGYTVYSLRGGVEVIDGLQVFAGIENLTDKDYRLLGSGQNEAGTNAIVGVDWTF